MKLFWNRAQWRLINVKPTIALFSLILFTTACAVGPSYHRPKADVPATYRGAPEAEGVQSNPLQQNTPSGPQRQASASAQQSLGDQKWWEVFQDPQLQDLIRTALKQNYD